MDLMAAAGMAGSLAETAEATAAEYEWRAERAEVDAELAEAAAVCGYAAAEDLWDAVPAALGVLQGVHVLGYLVGELERQAAAALESAIANESNAAAFRDWAAKDRETCELLRQRAAQLRGAAAWLSDAADRAALLEEEAALQLAA